MKLPHNALSVLLITGLCLFTNPQILNAAEGEEVRYIRDTLFVPLRSGQSFKHRIVHKGLVSGAKLTLLEESEDNNYSLVRTSKGIEGWIQTQYLSNEPAARNQLKQLQKKYESLLANHADLKATSNTSESKLNDAKMAIASLTQKLQSTETELADIKALSANAISLNSSNKQLLQDNQALQNKVDLLTTDNQRLNDSLDNDEFINGAFAVLIGVFITLLVPRLWPSKSSEWA